MDANIYIYGAIGQGGVTSTSIKDQLAAAKNADRITVHISSQGGEVYEGYTIYNLLKNCGKPIDVVIEGFCASIATLVALSGDTVAMNSTASFMIHNPFVGVEGDAEALRQAASHLDVIKSELIKVYSSKTGLGESELWAMMDNETYFTAEQAQTIGFVKVLNEQFKAVATIDITKINTLKMAQPNLMDAFKNELNGIKNLIAKLVTKPKNIDAALEDGTVIYIEAEEGSDIMGAAIYKLAEDGTTEALADGEYTLTDGSKVTVADGKVSAFVEGATLDEAEALKVELASLKSELIAKDETIATIQNQIAEKDLALVELNAKIETVLASLPAGETPQNISKKGFVAIGKSKEQDSPIASWGQSILKEKVRI